MSIGVRLLVLGAFTVSLSGCFGAGTQGTGPIALVDSNTDAHPVIAGPPTVMAGGTLARTLSPADQHAARDAEYRALEFGSTGVPVSWRNGKDYGDVVPGAAYHVNAFDCRDLTHTIHVGGESQSSRSTACRQANGSWQPIS